MIIHVDGDGFYAACERLFRPDLDGRPIAVLSDNDAIIVAANRECKDLGFKRGDAFCRVQAALEKCGVELFSSNFPLYTDISARLNVLYSRFSAEVEIYSIDESFLELPEWNNVDYTALGGEIREAAQNEIGVAVSVGIAPTKTLAKMCNKLAKRKKGGTAAGVCEWAKLEQDDVLKHYPAGSVWGIGEKKKILLESQGIHTAYDLKHYPLDKARRYLTIVGFRIVRELNGIPAIGAMNNENRQQIICSRSFRRPVTDFDDIAKALTVYTAEAVRRLRTEKAHCKNITVFLTTNPYSPGRQYANQATDLLAAPTDYLGEIQSAAAAALRSIYRAGYRYHKTAIMLAGFSPAAEGGGGLFPAWDSAKKRRFMAALDDITAKYGSGALRAARAVYDKQAEERAAWQPGSDYRSPAYTLNPADLPRVF